MSRLNRLLVQASQIVPAINPIDLSAGNNDGDWISMKGYERCAVVFFKGAGTAGQDPVLTLRQATDVTGANAKALNFTRIDVKKGVLTNVGVFTKVTQAAANTYTPAGDANMAGLYVIEVKAEDLDCQNNFDCIQFQVPDVGANAQIGMALYVLRGPRFAGDVLPSAIID